MNEEKKEIRNFLCEFIKEMNDWEKLCNKMDRDKTLARDERAEKLKQVRKELFDKYITQRVRKHGGPDSICYGEEGSYDYDPEDEVIIEIDVEKNKSTVITERTKPMREKYQYILKRTRNGWLIDNKKRYNTFKERWVAHSL